MQAEGITKERLASYDRAITAEPSFSKQQCEGLDRDLKAYLLTLQVRCPSSRWYLKHL